MPAFLLAIPAWAWLTGAATIGGAVIIDQTGDTAEQMGDAAEKSAGLAKWFVIGGIAYASYRVAKSTGAIK